MRLREVKETLLAGILMIALAFGSVSCSSDNNGVEPPQQNDEVVKVATFNVRYNNQNDAGNLWIDRRHLVAEILRIYQFDIFGAQEPYIDQLTDMVQLSPDYAYVGRSRTGQENSGEFAPIFYHKDRIEILESGQFWLTDDDRTQPNVGWDAAQPRTCVWAKVRHKVANETFYVFNVHLDHVGVRARTESTRLLMEEVPAMAEGFPYFLVGDFNFDQNSANFQLLKASTALVDTYDIAQQKINANRGTLNNFNPNSGSTARIDHIFVNRQHTPTILRHQIITNSFQGKLPSDHFPVMVEVTF